MKFEKRVVGKVIGLGIAPFIMQSTESLVNITLNAGLQRYGGDLYVGSMTIMQSVMQMLVMPIQGITQGAQPIMSYNYGAKNYSRVRKTFSLLLKVMLLVTVSGFALAALLPGVLARMFTQDAELIEIVKKMMPIFFGGIWAFGAQMACQTTFMALGQAKISPVPGAAAQSGAVGAPGIAAACCHGRQCAGHLYCRACGRRDRQLYHVVPVPHQAQNAAARRRRTRKKQITRRLFSNDGGCREARFL